MLSYPSPCHLGKHGPNHSNHFGGINVGIDSRDTRSLGRLYVPVRLGGTNFRSEQQTSLIVGREG